MAKWLLKSEPSTYGWADLVHDGGTDWDGVRNAAARLHLRAMRPGDEALFYHSGAERAVVGIARIAGPPQPDGADGTWVKVAVKPLRPLARAVTLGQIKTEPALAGMQLIRQSRLSVVPVRTEEWDRVMEMAGS